MPELITQILILVGVFFLVRFLLWSFIPRSYLTWLGIIVLLMVLAIAFLEPGNRTAGILWGILSFPLRPLGLSLILLGYGLRLGPKIVAARPQVLAAFLILLISSLPITAYLLTAQTEQRSALEISQRPAGNVQAIVVLGDGTLPSDPVYRIRTQLSNPNNGLSVALESRLLYAAQLYNTQISQGNSPPLIVVSTGPQAILARPGATATDAITAFLGKAGIPAEQIFIDSTGVDPRSSAEAVRTALLGPQAQNCEIYAVCGDGDFQQLPDRGQLGSVIPIILVTPAITIRRSASTFINLNFEVVPRPTDFYVFQIQGGLRLAALTDLIPNAEALAITTRVIDEYLAWLYYFMRGWLNDPLSV